MILNEMVDMSKSNNYYFKINKKRRMYYEK